MYYQILSERHKALYDKVMASHELYDASIMYEFSIDAFRFFNDFELFRKILRYISFDHPEIGISFHSCWIEDNCFKTMIFPVRENWLSLPTEEELKRVDPFEKITKIFEAFDSVKRIDSLDEGGADTASYVFRKCAGNSLGIALASKCIFDRFGIESYIQTGITNDNNAEIAWNYVLVDNVWCHFNAYLARNGRWNFHPSSECCSISDESKSMFGTTISSKKSPTKEEETDVLYCKLNSDFRIGDYTKIGDFSKIRDIIENRDITKNRDVIEIMEKIRSWSPEKRIDDGTYPHFTDIELEEMESEDPEDWSEENFLDSCVVYEDDDFCDSSNTGREKLDGFESPIVFDYAHPAPIDISIDEKKCLVDKVDYAVITDKRVEKGDVCYINFAMFDETNKNIVDTIREEYESPTVTTSGDHLIQRGVEILVILTSPQIEGLYLKESFNWNGGRSVVQFYFDVPEDYDKKTMILNFDVFANGLKLSKLSSRVIIGEAVDNCQTSRQDVKEAFISYSSKDRYEVSLLVQGMSSIYEGVHLFWDVESLRSGDNWRKKIDEAIMKSDVLYLCWSENAASSENVKYEWQTGIRLHSVDFVVPIPLEAPNPELCPVPDELNSKHFNDMAVYIRHYLKNK